MRPLIFSVLLASAAFAQQRGSAPPSVGSLNPIGATGNILHPGIPATPAPGAYAPRSGAPYRNPGQGGRRGNLSRGGTTLVVPYPAYGYGFDGFYGPGYGGSNFYSPEPGAYDPIFGVYNPGIYNQGGPYPANYGSAGSQTPTVVINQNFAPDQVNPRMVDFSNAPPADSTFRKITPYDSSAQSDANSQAQAAPADPGPKNGLANGPAYPPANPGPPSDQAPMYLIAMKDHTIYPAMAYWVIGDTLNYVTLQGVQNHTSLNLVDRDLSKRLNNERNLDFRLPSQ